MTLLVLPYCQTLMKLAGAPFSAASIRAVDCSTHWAPMTAARVRGAGMVVTTSVVEPLAPEAALATASCCVRPPTAPRSWAFMPLRSLNAFVTMAICRDCSV